ncbi:MAG: hypothetical protein HC800_19745 [Phormidesmis sp. RL_2_1]|nr:hypothetical protein [Phormidesmis sp. RL_2_1]
MVAANSQLSPTALSHPSLLWIQDQLGSRYGSNRLIEQWQAYQTFDGLNYVDVVVNQPIWNLLNYFERYAFILQFGNAARDYGYNLRVFHSGDVINVRNVRGRDNRISRNTAARTITLRGAYLCSFPEGNGLPPTTAAEYACSIVLDESSSRPGLRNPL